MSHLQHARFDLVVGEREVELAADRLTHGHPRGAVDLGRRRTGGLGLVDAEGDAGLGRVALRPSRPALR